jgi:hypothetical protein
MMMLLSVNLKLGSLHPVASTRSGSGSGFPSDATLFEYLFSILFNYRYMFVILSDSINQISISNH